MAQSGKRLPCEHEDNPSTHVKAGHRACVWIPVLGSVTKRIPGAPDSHLSQ